MSAASPQPIPPPTPFIQFRVRTLLLLYVVLGSSLAVFGVLGIAVFGFATWFAVYLRRAERVVSWRLFAFFIDYYAPGVHAITADGKVHMLQTEGLTDGDLSKVLQIGGCAEQTLGRRVLFDDCETSVNWPNIAALAVWLASTGTLLVGAVRGRKATWRPDGWHVRSVVES